MSKTAQWYFVDNGERKGPVSREALQKMMAEGKVASQTLVWCEGMKDWQKAGSVTSLATKPVESSRGKPGAARKTSPSNSDLPKVNVQPRPNPNDKASVSVKKSSESASSEIVTGTKPTGGSASREAIAGTDPLPKVVPAAASPVEQAPTEASGGRPATGGQAEPQIQSAPGIQIQTDDPAFATSNPTQRGPHRPLHSGWMKQFQVIGYPCLIAGFLLVLTGKGCDSLGNRYAARLQANSSLAEQKFAARYDSRVNALQAQVDAINESQNPDGQRASNLQKQISDLRSDQAKERRQLQTSTWADMRATAAMAQANNQAWGFYRELVFVFGSMVLSVGLLIVGITGDGSEKWVCLIMLAIITFSLYVGGIAWISSITSSIPMRGF